MGLTGDALHAALHDIIDGNIVIPLSGGSFDTHDAIDLLQEDPANPNNVILIYSGYSVPKSSWPAYNREHVWPVSYGATDGTPANSDVFNIYGCDADVNAERGNRYYDDCTSGCSSPAEAPQCFFDQDSWEPRDSEKGDIARVLFYMDVRYEGGVAGEPDLVLGDGAPASGCDCMGLLSTLIAWNQLDPPDAAEEERNDLIYSQIQGNRNPFVDHPEWVDAIWGSGNPGGGGIPWINEIHYDNAGTDVDEGVELAGAAGTNLAGWSLVAYNGSTGASYATIPLSGTIADQQGGFGTIWFPVANLQNGSPDGIALVNVGGDVVEFLSYEGSFAAADGPAMGLVSDDIGVSEDSSTTVGLSLQLTGSGNAATDFIWGGPAPSSRGLPNAGQSFAVAGPLLSRGDVSGDGSLLLNDALVLLSYLFAGGSVPCLDACDVDDDGQVLINDPLYLLGYLFGSGPPPADPFPACGQDLTPDSAGSDLGCDVPPACP